MLVKGKDESAIRWIDFHYYSKFFLMIENDVDSCDTDLLEGLQNLKCFIESI
jgi:hypothetical protein